MIVNIGKDGELVDGLRLEMSKDGNGIPSKAEVVRLALVEAIERRKKNGQHKDCGSVSHSEVGKV